MITSFSMPFIVGVMTNCFLIWNMGKKKYWSMLSDLEYGQRRNTGARHKKSRRQV
jgi:hypothetical protein